MGSRPAGCEYSPKVRVPPIWGVPPEAVVAVVLPEVPVAAVVAVVALVLLFLLLLQAPATSTIAPAAAIIRIHRCCLTANPPGDPAAPCAHAPCLNAACRRCSRLGAG